MPRPRTAPTPWGSFQLSHEMTWSGDRLWHDTDSDVIVQAMLAEGFCPRMHGPLARGADPEFYAWCHTCEKGWSIQALFHGEDRVDIHTDQWEADSEHAAGPEQPRLPFA